jgi:hypothetical protein
VISKEFVVSQMTTVPPVTPAQATAAAAELPQLGELLPIVQGLLSDLTGVFEQMLWAEEEIVAAQKRHPALADRIFHSWSLLVPKHDRMATDFVYRSHCRELLDRVARGEDTRPGTAAEACCAMLDTSQLAPLRSSGVGFYMRMWTAAGFPEIEGFAEASGHHEALEKPVIDEHEEFVRRKLAVEDRRLGDITCCGRHHGETVACAYAKPEQLTLTD